MTAYGSTFQRLFFKRYNTVLTGKFVSDLNHSRSWLVINSAKVIESMNLKHCSEHVVDCHRDFDFYFSSQSSISSPFYSVCDDDTPVWEEMDTTTDFTGTDLDKKEEETSCANIETIHHHKPMTNVRWNGCTEKLSAISSIHHHEMRGHGGKSAGYVSIGQGFRRCANGVKIAIYTEGIKGLVRRATSSNSVNDVKG